MTPDISISAGKATLEDGSSGFGIKIQTSASELNVWIRIDEVNLLGQVKSARWENGGSLQIGHSAGVPVFWSVDDQSLSVLVGHDDESWDFGLMLPLPILNQIIEEIQVEQ